MRHFAAFTDPVAPNNSLAQRAYESIRVAMVVWDALSIFVSLSTGL